MRSAAVSRCCSIACSPRSALSTSVHAVTMSPLPDPRSISTSALHNPAAVLHRRQHLSVKKARPSATVAGSSCTRAIRTTAPGAAGAGCVRPASSKPSTTRSPPAAAAAASRASGSATPPTSAAARPVGHRHDHPGLPVDHRGQAPAAPLVASTTGRSEPSMPAIPASILSLAPKIMLTRMHPGSLLRGPPRHWRTKQLWPSHLGADTR